METREIVREFVGKELNRRHRGTPVQFADSDSLLTSNKTDSLFFVDLIVFLEKKFSLKLNASAIGKDDLDSIDKMVALIDTGK